MLACKLQFAAPNAAGNVSYVCTDPLSGQVFQPDGIILWGTRNLTDPSWIPHQSLSFGLIASNAQRVMAIASTHAVGTTVTGKRMAALPYSVVSTTGTVQIEASLTSIDLNGFTLNWTTVASGKEYLVNALALGGADLTNAFVGDFVTGSVTGAKTVTGIPFQPDFVIMVGSNTAVALPYTATFGMINIAAVDTAGRTRSASFDTAHNTVGTQNAQWHTNLFMSSPQPGVTTKEAEATFTNWTSDGWAYNLTQAHNDRYAYLALQGGKYFVGSDTQPAGTGSQSKTGVSFQGVGALFFGNNKVADANIDISTEPPVATMFLGGADSLNEAVVLVNDRDGIATSDVHQHFTGGSVIRHAHESPSNTVEGLASLTTFDLDGYTLNWTTSDGTAREFSFVIFGPTEVAGTPISSEEVPGRVAPFFLLPGADTAWGMYDGMSFGGTHVNPTYDASPPLVTVDYLDSATVPVVIGVSSTESVDFSDDTTVVPMLISLSSVEVHEIPDSATVPMLITVTSTAETAQFVDSGSVYVDLQVASADVVADVDAATVAMVIGVTSVETAQFVETATVYVDISTSAVELHEIPDAATVRVSISIKSGTYRDLVLSDGPVGYWRLGESSGSTATDISGHSHNGTYSGTPGYGVAGAVPDGDTAIQFSGDDTIAIADDADFDFTRTSPFSVECWFKTTASGNCALVSKLEGATGYRGWEILILSGSGVQFSLIDTYPTAGIQRVGTAQQNDGNWHHCVVTYDGSGAAAGVVIYIDGAAVASTIGIDTLSPGSTTTNAQSVSIGQRTVEVGNTVYVGMLDEVAVYPYVLSATRVAAHYATPPTDIAQFVDAATVYVDIQTSAADVLAAIEANTVYVDIQTSAADTLQAIDAATVGMIITVTSVESIQVVEAATVYVDINTSATEVHEIPDAATVYVDIDTSGSEVFTGGGTGYTESATVPMLLSLSAVEVHEIPDVGTVPILISVSSTELAQYIETATVYVDMDTSAVEAAQFVDAATVYVDIQTSTADIAQFVDATTVPVTITPSAADVEAYVEAGTVYVDIDCSGVEDFTHSGSTTDATTVPMVISLSAIEAAQLVDANTVRMTIGASAADIAAFIDATTIPIDIDCSGTELAGLIESATVYVDIIGSSAETYERVDAAVIPVVLSVTSVPLFIGQDAQTILILLSPSAIDLQGKSDQATVYVDIQPSTLILTVDFILEIVGVQTRYIVDSVKTRMSVVGSAVGRLSILGAVSRWAVLETRRRIWKS